MTMKRRDALKTIGGLAGMAGMTKLLPACGGNDDDGPVGITTYVYLMMENRTYDHALGGRALEGLGGDGLRAGLANRNMAGTSIAPFAATLDHMAAAPTVCDSVDPPHGRAASLAQFNAGAMDGFVTEYEKQGGTDAATMKFLTREHQPITWALADAYTSCDRWFASVMGPTLPNRAYWHTGTSFGLLANDEVIDRFSGGVPVPTIYNRLNEAGVDWAYYAGNIAVAALLAQPGPYQVDLGPNDGTGNVRRFGDHVQGNGVFFEDAKNGTLPTVCYIDPAFGYNDDHPPVHPILGQELIASVYTALAKSPQWKNCLLVVTYDEHGGYYDHVAPPTTVDDTLEKFGVDGLQQMGFRVPTLVAGPYVKQGHVSNVTYDHTSALKHLQTTFGLASLNVRVDAANDLMDCIDLDRLAAGTPAAPITLPEVISDEWPINDPSCQGDSGFARLTRPRKADDPLTAWADANPGRVPGFDLRGDEQVYLQGIRDFLKNNRTSI